MGLLFCILSFSFALGLTRRSVGAGLAATLTSGYLYGILRARFLDGFSHFIFDAGLFGLYLGYFLFGRYRAPRAWSASLGRWAWALGLWPVCVLLLSPFLDGQPPLVQLVGLRAAVMFLPMLVIGARLKDPDLEVLSRCAMWLNVMAFGFAALELAFGVPAFFPQNAATAIIYSSTDIGPENAFRIPASFSSAHAYAGTLVASLPLLAYRWQLEKGRKLVLLLSTLLTLLGVFISGARTPVAQLGLMLLLLLVTTRLSPRLVALLLVAGAVLGYVVETTPRFQRFRTLEDTDYVEARLNISINRGLVDIITDYPMGAGLASAVGTSIPYFLQDEARPQLGLENEYSRLALEQGLLGLLLWLAFIVWVVLRWPRRGGGGNLFGRRGMWALVCVSWSTAFIGAGLLVGIPSALLLMTQMGVVASTRWRSQVPVAAASPLMPASLARAAGGRA